jgi:hypothetical protein
MEDVAPRGLSRLGARPLARDLSAGCEDRKVAVAICSSAPPQGDRRERSCTSRRLRVWYCGVRTAVVVLADRSDCRSRRAARGPSRPRAKSTWITTMGLASPRESAGRSERAPEAGSSAAKRRDRWRAPIPNQLPRKRCSGSTRRWKAPGIGAAALLDGRAVKAVLAVVGGSAQCRARGDGDVGVRGRSPAPSGPTRPRLARGRVSVPDASTSERRRRGFHRERMGRS